MRLDKEENQMEVEATHKCMYHYWDNRSHSSVRSWRVLPLLIKAGVETAHKFQSNPLRYNLKATTGKIPFVLHIAMKNAISV